MSPEKTIKKHRMGGAKEEDFIAKSTPKGCFLR